MADGGIAVTTGRSARWFEAARAAALLAIDPVGLRGAVVRGGPGPVRDRWIGLLQSLLPATAGPVGIVRMPGNIDVDALLGGLDLIATLASGHRQWSAGLLARAGAGLVVIPMAERLSPAMAAMVGQAVRSRSIRIERDGFDRCDSFDALVLTCDDTPADEPLHWNALSAQLGMVVDLSGISLQAIAHDLPDADTVEASRARLATVTMPANHLHGLCRTAERLGIHGMIAPLIAARVARASAALSGYREVADHDLATAAGLVYAQRAEQVPAQPPRDPTAASPPEDAAPESAQAADAPDVPDTTDPSSAPTPARADNAPDNAPDNADASTNGDEPVTAEPSVERSLDETTDIVVAAALAAIPANLLASLNGVVRRASTPAAPGRFGAQSKSLVRGRPMGAVRGRPVNGARLHLLETLRAAIPQQRLRQRCTSSTPGCSTGRSTILFRPEDFRVRRFRQSAGSLAIFVVDASGSAALQRLAEAKGAIELLLADCYVRRDSVALVSFRGRQAQILLAPTRSLTRARRELSHLPGGGGTPMAAGLVLACRLIDQALHAGQRPSLIMLTDGRANVALDGSTAREQARDDSLRMARMIALRPVTSLVIDTSLRAGESAKDVAQAMNATCLALPYADAGALDRAVRHHRAGA